MQVPGPFEYERATSVDHAIGLLDRLGEGARVVAGGHSLLPMMKLRIANPEYLVDINDLALELGYVITDPTLVRIGAMTRHRELLESETLAAVCPIFRDAEGLTEEEESEEEAVEVLTPEPAAAVERAAEEGEEEEDEEPEDEDVEASLDVILKERLVVEDEPEDEEPTDVEDRSEMTERVLPKQPDEFVCRSCFLVKHPSQLADKKKMYCRDCV